ncbi:hypothetical protein [Proteiniphilum acetatigenes]|uniref:hypothetical protein n=1 Tax=Proteiniphilum acetatigenes TaxID=294710 RepID=UPI00037E8CA6|nr:hypothetical protein [Proteiniphilum acetatigenes]
MRVLIYKRTHKHDPDERGIFGIQDCMGQIRNWNYDAVIGIGGKSAWKGHTDIKYKINWVGLEPKVIGSTKRGNIIAFAHFELYEEKGKDIKKYYPNLFDYMYVGGSRKRFDMSSELPESVFEEVKEILDSIKDSPASESYDIESNEELEDFNPLKCTGCIEGEKIEVTIQSI